MMADLAGDEEQNLPALVIQAEDIRGIEEPDRFQVSQQSVDRRVQWPVERRTVSPTRTTTLVFPP
jgi:hypothetical protein